MARVIAIKDEYLTNSDEATLQAVIETLCKAFLLIDLGDYRIEVNEQDYNAVSRVLDECRRDAELNAAQ